jgi:hypothetical protein
MATLEQVKSLEIILINSRFSIIPKGVHNLKDVYKLVKTFYPSLCDDNIKRPDNKEKEWQHQVRLALLKMQDKPAVIKVNEGKQDGIWEFN